jgi:hypothetical protein
MMAFMVDILMSATVPACTPPRLDLDQAIDGIIDAHWRCRPVG